MTKQNLMKSLLTNALVMTSGSISSHKEKVKSSKKLRKTQKASRKKNRRKK